MHYLLSSVVALAVFFDLHSGKIPNFLTIPAFCIVLIYQLVYFGFNAWLLSMGLSLFAFIIFVFPFLMNFIGGGDIKLIMVLAAMTSSAEKTFELLVNIGLWGGVVAIAGMALKPHVKHSKLTGLTLLSKNKLPYSIAIALGFFMPVFW